MTINEKMFEIMEKKQIKARYLADQLEISEAVVSNWKKRKTDPPAKMILNICKVLEVPILELLGMEPEELSDQEQELLKLFRNCSADNKKIILGAASSLSNVELEKENASVYKIG